MPRFCIALLFLCFVAVMPSFGAQQAETRLLRNPSISDESVVFTYANDIWITSRTGGTARRVTTHPGIEFFARLSPDGKWIAFTGQIGGDYDVYVVPTSGGEPRRLTWYPGYDQVVGWTPDGKGVLFFSRRLSIINPVNGLFRVDVEGGFARQLPLPDTGYASLSLDGRRVAYNRVSTEYRNWKRYRGGRQSFISIYNTDTNDYSELPHTDAADLAPMWFENKIYFVSDRDRIMNLYSYELTSKRTVKLTNFTEFDVKYPSLGGSSQPAIIFENGGRLHSYDLRGGKLTQLQIKAEGDLPQAAKRIVNASDNINSFEISSDGSSALFGARGEIFTVDPSASTQNLSRTSGSRELQPTYSPDGRSMAYFSDISGEYNVYLRSLSAGAAAKKITDFRSGYLSNPKWSPDSRKIVFSNEKLELYVVDAETGKLDLIDRSQNNEIFNYSWSPDSRFIAYPKFGDNQYRQILLYSIEDRRSIPVTNGQYDDRNPVFAPTGKYLFFLSNRAYKPAMQFSGRSDTDWGVQFTDNTGVYFVVLNEKDKSPFVKAPLTGNGRVELSQERLQERTVSAPIPLGNYTNLRANGSRLFFISRASAGSAQLNAVPAGIRTYNFETGDLETIVSGSIGSFQLSFDGKKLIYSGDGYTIIDARPDPGRSSKPLDLSRLTFDLDPKAEWKQIFDEAWRIQRDFYYDAKLNGVDWSDVRRRYEPLLPYVAHREDLNYLLGEMISELGTGHLYVGDGDQPYPSGPGVGVLAAEYQVVNGLYRFSDIYVGDADNRSPLRAPGVDVKVGDYLLAVNGKPITSSDEPYSFFVNTVGKDVVLTVNDRPSMQGSREVTVRPIPNEMSVRYIDWVARNRQKVVESTGGKCGYMHVPDIGARGINEFAKGFYAQIDRKCMVIDARWNGGGYFASYFVDMLQRRSYATYTPRYGNDLRISQSAIDGPKVMLVNEYNISGGDAFPYFFQKAGLGPVIGVRTAGATIGNTGTPPMIDGGFVETSALALTELVGGRKTPILENRGVIPDIVVDNAPDRVMNGRDPQLEKAIETINVLTKKATNSTNK